MKTFLRNLDNASCEICYYYSMKSAICAMSSMILLIMAAICMVAQTTLMPDELRERIEKLAKEYGLSQNKLITMACEEFLRSGRLDELEKRIEAIEQRLDELDQN